jgi:tetratricopeptide (TPR) repeat protein
MTTPQSRQAFVRDGRGPASVSVIWLLLAFLALCFAFVLHAAEHAPPAGGPAAPPIGAPAGNGSTHGEVKEAMADVAASVSPTNRMNSENLLPAHEPVVVTDELAEQERLQSALTKVETGRHLRRERSPKLAIQVLTEVLDSNAPAEAKRMALLELGLAAQDDGKLTRAQSLFTQYVQQYKDDPAVPEVFLRQGLIYRQMGVNDLARAKFYSVMNSALSMKVEQFDYYKRLVLQAQTEIADTYYLQGLYADAADFFMRVLKQDDKDLNRLQIRFKLVRCFAAVGRHSEAVAISEVFLKEHSAAAEVAEVRFLLASSLKHLGRNREAMRQVLELLASQQSQATRNPEAWAYWQQRAGNDVANQLYKEGDYLNALEIYMNLAEMNASVGWQLPVWYQIGLVCERLHQPKKASDYYGKIIARSGELSTSTPPSLRAVVDMARWRQDYLGWQTGTEAKMRQLQPHLSTNMPAVAASAAP